MFISENGGALVMDVPNTGAQSLAAAMGLRLHTERHLKPQQAGEAFKACPVAGRVLVVRSVADRFVSAGTMVLAMGEQHWRGQGFESLADVVEALQPATPEQKAVALLEHVAMTAQNDLPPALQLQKRWHTRAFGLAIATHDMAAYAMAHGLHVAHRQTWASNPALRWARVAGQERASVRSLLAEVYAQDVEALATFKVWAPQPGVVRFVSGTCRTCAPIRKP